MRDVLGFSPILGTTIVAVYFISVFFPILFSGFIVLRQRRSLQRGLLFVVTVTGMTYGLFLFLFLALQFPMTAYKNLVAPQLNASNLPYGQWLVDTSRFLDSYGFAFYPLIVAVVSVLLGRYLAARWNHIVSALKV
jgi:hypothetical protein